MISRAFLNILFKIVSFSVLPIAFFSVQRYTANPLGSTSFWWLVQSVLLTAFVLTFIHYFKGENKKRFLFLNIYLIWVFFSIIRGFFKAELYWDYKMLTENVLSLFLPVIAYIAANMQRLQSILSVFVKYGLPLIIFILPFYGWGIWGWYMFPVSFLVLFFPVLKTNWKIILLVISLIAIFENITTRSHVIKYGVPMILLSFYYLRFFIASDQIMRITQIVFMLVPWVFFGLAVGGIFNVFNLKEYTNLDGTVKVEENQPITEDSRTFIYEEVLNSSIKYNYWLLGRTPARGNETVWFEATGEKLTGRSERYRNEPNITNTFTWMGIVGVVLYFLVFFKASFIAVYKSNNIFIKLIGLFVAFRWMYAWVEDIYLFDMNSMVIWLMIGICFSETFRRMNNAEVKLWARGIFDNKYSVAFKHYILLKYKLSESNK